MAQVHQLRSIADGCELSGAAFEHFWVLPQLHRIRWALSLHDAINGNGPYYIWLASSCTQVASGALDIQVHFISSTCKAALMGPLIFKPADAAHKWCQIPGEYKHATLCPHKEGWLHRPLKGLQPQTQPEELDHTRPSLKIFV